MSLAHKLENVDRRWVFLLVAITMTLPFFFNWKGCMEVRVSNPVQKAYDFIEKMPEGTRVIVSFDYGPSTVAEIGPGAVGIIKHLMKRKAKIVAIALWPDAPAIASEMMTRLGEEAGMKVNEDWCFLGYKYGGPTGAGVIEPMGTDFKSVFPFTKPTRGADSVPSTKIPILEGANGYEDFGLLVSFAAGVPGVKEYVQMANSRYNIPVISAVSRVTAPELYPFLDSGQLAGLLPGVSSGAEYEKLLGYEGLAHAILPVQSVTQLMVIVLVIFGNVLQFLNRRRR